MKNWFKYRFDWMMVYFSPFKPIIPKLYIGKVAIGTPYFLPRKWVKATPQRAINATVEELKNIRKFNERNPEYKRKEKSFSELYDEKMRYSYAVPKKIGFDFVGHGWKTKWTPTDYRHESSPVWSFVFFKWQIALIFNPIEAYHYWECWLYYSRHTTGKTETRLKKARKKFPCIWNSTKDGVETKTCYWDVILKEKWL
jgi:hypothetical protein